MKNRTFHIFILLLCLFFVSTSYSQSIEDVKAKQKKSEKEIDYLNKLLKEAKENKSASSLQLNLIKRKIASTISTLNSLESEKNILDKNIDKNTLDIANLKQRKEALKKLYANIVLEIWKRQHNSKDWAFIVSSKDINQAYRRLKYFEQLKTYARKQFVRLEEINDSLVATDRQLNKLLSEKSAVISNINRKKSDLAQEQKVQNAHLNELSKKEKQLNSKLKQEIANRKKLDAVLKKLIEEQVRKSQTNKNTSSKEFKLSANERLLSDNFASNKGRLPWPVQEGIITEKFGLNIVASHSKVKLNNDGVNITTSKNSKVRAIFNGVVTSLLYVSGSGNTVIVRHGSYLSVYSNLGEVFVKEGDKVSTRQELGVLLYDQDKGSVLKFQIWKDFTKLNPELWLAK